jgi:RNA polymerase sigma-70 factor, ECF subfamily
MDAEETSGLVHEALAGDQAALTRLVAALTPVIQARVARTLLARRSCLTGDRNVRQEVEDLAQEIFLSLFSRGAHVLRSWQAERGLSLENFVGLVSERYVVSFLRSGKRNPWKEEPSLIEDLDGASLDSSPEEVTASREELRLLLERLREKLSPLGRHLFELLFVQERSLPETMAASGLSADAVYAWRSRLRRLAQELLGELSGKTAPARKSRKDGAA